MKKYLWCGTVILMSGVALARAEEGAEPCHPFAQACRSQGVAHYGLGACIRNMLANNQMPPGATASDLEGCKQKIAMRGGQKPLASHPGASAGKSECLRHIKERCLAAGFKDGHGLWTKCIDPIRQGKAAPAGVNVDPAEVQQCHTDKPLRREGGETHQGRKQ